MSTIEITGRTVEEAIKRAVKEFNVTKDNLKIEVMEEASKGFLGIIGGKEARIKASIAESPLDVAKKYLENVISKIGISTKIEILKNSEYTRFVLYGEKLGVLIGRRGETLDAIQYLVNIVANKNADNRVKIVLDAEGYRQRREDTLRRLARRMEEKVKRTETEVVLEPMSPQERRIIHTALQDSEYVRTLSEGQEPYRKVVIYPISRY